MSEKKNNNLWWPSITTIAAANDCARTGTAVAVFCATVTGALAVAAMAGHSYLGITPWSLVDASIFGVLAFGISRRSKLSAAVAPVFYLVERIYAWGTSQPPSTLGGVLALILLMAFINSTRGVIAFHRLKQTAPIEPQDA